LCWAVLRRSLRQKCCSLGSFLGGSDAQSSSGFGGLG
jgi:hypothetical protein